jgi:hypothetical protein
VVIAAGDENRNDLASVKGRYFKAFLAYYCLRADHFTLAEASSGYYFDVVSVTWLGHFNDFDGNNACALKRKMIYRDPHIHRLYLGPVAQKLTYLYRGPLLNRRYTLDELPFVCLVLVLLL